MEFEIDYKECPKCHKKATTKKEVKELFGYRLTNKTRIVQSYCFKCRRDSSGSRLLDKVKIEEESLLKEIAPKEEEISYLKLKLKACRKFIEDCGGK